MAGSITRPLDAELFPLPGVSVNVPNDLSGITGDFDVASDGTGGRAGPVTAKPVIAEQTVAGLKGSIQSAYFDDYYDQIWVIPKAVDFGSVSGDAFSSVSIWNAYWRNNVVLSSIAAANDEGLFLTGPSIPKTFKPLENSSYNIQATTDGPATIDASYTLTFSNGFVVSIPVSGNRARSWAAYHNWKESFVATYTFQTEILTSRSGKEQRIAHRLTPRRKLSYERLISGGDFRAFNDLMWSWQNRTFVMPELTRKVVLESPVAAFTDTIVLPTLPRWLVVGANVMAIYQDQQETRTVASIAGNEVKFKTRTALQWPARSKLYNAVSGFLDPTISTVRKTSHTATANLTFTVVPLSEPYIDPSVKRGPILNGREVLELRPNWANDIGVDMQHDYETVDYGRGPISRFFPIAFGTMIRTHTFLNRTAEDAENVIEFFHRQLGSQGEFYAPTWDADIIPKKLANAGTANLRIEGRGFFEVYGASTVHKAVAVRMFDGTMIYRKVQSIIAVTDTEGTDSVITIEGVWPLDVGPDSIAFISWCLVWRFASDILTIENLTDEVSQFNLALRSLEDLTPETF